MTSENRVENAGKIIVLRPRAVLKLSGEGKSTEAQKVVEHGMGILAREERDVFGEVKGLEPYFNVAPSEKRSQFSGEELCVGTSDIDVKVLAGVEPVDEFFEFGDVLDFVKEHVCLTVFVYAGFDEFPYCAPIREGGIVWVFEIDCNDLGMVNSVSGELFPEEFKQGCFPASANAGYNLDYVFVSPVGEPVNKTFSVYFAIVHAKFSSLRQKLVGMIAFSDGKVNRRDLIYCSMKSDFTPLIVITTHPDSLLGQRASCPLRSRRSATLPLGQRASCPLQQRPNRYRLRTDASRAGNRPSIPARIAGRNHLTAMKNREYAVGVGYGFVMIRYGLQIT